MIGAGVVCAVCGAPPRMRYPGGDPENGAADLRCRCPSAQIDPMWQGEPVDENGWPVCPDGCQCGSCLYDIFLEMQMQEECLSKTGGKHEFFYTGDGDAESGPSSHGEIVCRYCYTAKP